MNLEFTPEKHYPKALESAENYFQERNFPFPYLSENDKSKLLALSNDVFGTYPQPPVGPYNLEHYINEALTPGHREYVLFGIDGYGVGSQAMHYYAVKEHVAIFVQAQLGVTEDPADVRKKINGVFHGISLIFQRMGEAEKQHLIQDGKRLLIVMSDFYGKGWEWISGDPKEWDKTALHPGGILSALASIPKQ